MLLKREGRARPGIKIVGGILLLASIAAMLGGCAWIGNWLNPNQDPIAVITATPTSGEAPLEVAFDASESFDPDGGEISSYQWHFGDGSPTAEGREVQHTFAHPGSYIVRLTIIDDEGTAGTVYVTTMAVRTLEDRTDSAGVATFTDGGISFEVRTVDDQGSPIRGITGTAITDGNDAIVSLADPDGRYIPRLVGLGETVVAPAGGRTVASKTLRRRVEYVLRSWLEFAGAGFQRVYKTHVPAGATEEYLNKHYRLWDTVELRVLDKTFWDGAVLGLTRGSLVIITAKVGQREALAKTIVWMIDQITEDIRLIILASHFRHQGYTDNQEFEIWRYKFTPVKGVRPFIIRPREEPGAREPLPLAPSNLRIVSSKLAPGGMEHLLVWNYNSDNETGFLIQRKMIVYNPWSEIPDVTPFAKIGEVGPGERTYKNIAPLAPYVLIYRVAAIAADGRLSEWATFDAVAAWRERPTELQAEASGPPLQVNLRWEDNSRNESGFHIYRWTGIGEGPWFVTPNTPWPLLDTVGAGVETFTDTKVKPGYTHRYFVLAFNGGEALPSNVATVFIPNQRPVADFTFKVSGLSVTFTDTSTDPDDNIVSRRWDFGDDNTLEAQNVVYTYSKADTYEVTLTVTDAGGLSTTATQTVTVTAPSPPDLTVTSVVLSKPSAQVGNTISVSFTVENKGGPISAEFLNSVFLSTTQYGGGGQKIPLGDFPMSLDGTISKTETVEITIPQVPAGSWYVAVFADCNDVVDEGPNENNNIESASLSVGSPPPSFDTTPPTIPTNLQATAISFTQIDLAWDASTDNVEVSGYKVYCGGTLLAQVDATSYSVMMLTPSTRYCFTVSAFDEAGNESDRSRQACATTAVGEGGSGPTASFTASPLTGDAPLTVRFDASGSSDPDGDIVYHWEFGDGTAFVAFGPTVSHQYTSEGSYVAVLTVTDDKGATDSASQTITVTAPGNILTGTIQVNAMLDGRPWEGSVSYFRLIGPGTWKVEGAAMVPAVFRDLPPGNWTFEFHSGGPSEATFSSVSPSSTQNLTAGGTITFTLNFVTTQPFPSLTFTDLYPSTITTSKSTYQATLSASGSNFYNVNQITFSWSGPDSGSMTWNKGDSNWNAAVTINSDSFMTLWPTVLYNASSTHSETWNWTVTLKDDSGATASQSFTVTYNP
jgi:PKD repeat protein